MKTLQEYISTISYEHDDSPLFGELEEVIGSLKNVEQFAYTEFYLLDNKPNNKQIKELTNNCMYFYMTNNLWTVIAKNKHSWRYVCNNETLAVLVTCLHVELDAIDRCIAMTEANNESPKLDMLSDKMTSMSYIMPEYVTLFDQIQKDITSLVNNNCLDREFYYEQ